MPNDLITIKALSEELNSILMDGKIDKITMPELDEVVFYIRANNFTYSLVASCNANAPRLHITSTRKPNPISAPTFLMLLRKHLMGGTINRIRVVNNDRIVALDISSKNDLKDTVEYVLIIELMGRYNNIILTENNKILDSIRHITFDLEQLRPILPNLHYQIPDKSKIDITDSVAIASLEVTNYSDIAQTVCQHISGFSKDTASTIKALIDSRLVDNLAAGVHYLYNIYGSAIWKPCLSVDSSGNYLDYMSFPYLDCGQYKFFDTLSDALDNYFLDKDNKIRKTNKTRDLSLAIKRYATRIEKRTADNINKLKECDGKESLRITGELITSNIYKIKKGDTQLVCTNYYTNEEVVIPLDYKLTPAGNSNVYFKKYNKLKTAEIYTTNDLLTLSHEQIYLASIKEALEISSTDIEYNEIKDELISLGAIKKGKVSKKLPKPSAPISLIIDGYRVFVGKNNLQNNTVTFEIGNSSDIWLHTKNYHGSHGIIKTEGRDAPPNLIAKVAAIVAFFSNAKKENKAEVDYTYRKNVKKGSALGLVTYTNYKTIVVTPTPI